MAGGVLALGQVISVNDDKHDRKKRTVAHRSTGGEEEDCLLSSRKETSKQI